MLFTFQTDEKQLHQLGKITWRRVGRRDLIGGGFGCSLDCRQKYEQSSKARLEEHVGRVPVVNKDKKIASTMAKRVSSLFYNNRQILTVLVG